MLKQFQALPVEQRVQDMKERDYLWCLLNIQLDREEELEQMCPECRSRIQENRCTCCGQPVEQWRKRAVNPSFDEARFARMKEAKG